MLSMRWHPGRPNRGGVFVFGRDSCRLGREGGDGKADQAKPSPPTTRAIHGRLITDKGFTDASDWPQLINRFRIGSVRFRNPPERQ